MNKFETLLKNSYDLEKEEPEKSAYWHLQQLRSKIKQLTIPVVIVSVCDHPLNQLSTDGDEAFCNVCKSVIEL